MGEAVRKVRGDFDDPVTIFVKNGVYKEKLLINATVNNLLLEGESADGVIITYGDYASLNNMGTSGSYTAKVEGNNITFKNITFENSAGPIGPAVAMHTIGDRLRFVNCRFLGNQDTLYTGGRNGRLSFEECYIEGTTDFIFGSATASSPVATYTARPILTSQPHPQPQRIPWDTCSTAAKSLQPPR